MGASWFQWLKEHYGIYLTDIDRQVTTMDSFGVYSQFTEALFQSSLVRSEVAMYNSAVALLVHLKYPLERNQLTSGILSKVTLINTVKQNAQEQLKVLNDQFEQAQQYFITSGQIDDSTEQVDELQASLEEAESGSRLPQVREEDEFGEDREEDDYDDEIKFEVCADVRQEREAELPQFIKAVPSLVSNDSEPETDSISSDVVSVTTLSDSEDEAKPEVQQTPQQQTEEPLEFSAEEQPEVLHYESSDLSECSQSHSEGPQESISGSLIVGETSSDSEDSDA